MATGINRGSIDLPMEVSDQIIQKVQESSAVMQLATKVDLPGRGITIPVILSDPEAAWVAETGKKKVSQGTLTTKQMTAYKLAVIEPFSNEFVRDMPKLYDTMVARIPLAMAKKFDQTVIGAVAKPGDNFDQLSGATALPITSDTAYTQIVTADGNISDAEYEMNGIAISPKMKTILLKALDGNKRPLFVPDTTSANSVPKVLSVPTYLNRGLYVPATTGSSAKPATVGVAGDWTKAAYGTVQGMQAAVSDQATLTLEDGTTLNLWQYNMVAVRFEIEVGFRAELSAFNLFTATA